MIGVLYRLGETKSRPGTYVRWVNIGGPEPRPVQLGVCATITQLNWGETGKPFRVERSQMDNLKEVIGTGVGADAIRQAFLGGATYVWILRIGDGGEKGTVTIDSDDAKTLVFQTLYETDREYQVLTRESIDGKSKDFIIMEEGRKLESHTVDTSGDEVEALKASIAKSKYLKFANGDATEIPVGKTADVSGGSNPTATAEDYVSNFETINKRFWDALFLDTTDIGIKAAANAFIRRRLEEGGRSLLFLATEDPEAPVEEGIAEAKTYNSFLTHLVGNGAKVADADLVGPLIAARVAGMVTSTSYKTGATFGIIDGSVELIGEPTNAEYGEANEGGLMTLSYNPDGMVQIERGINTLVAMAEDEDAGWKKIRRVKTRFFLIEDILYKIDKIIRPGVDNSEDTRAFICQQGDSTIQQMIRDGALQSGKMVVDPDRAPQGDSAWFVFQDIVDLDSLEKVYNTAEFQY